LRTTMPDFFCCTACAQRHWHWHRQSCAHLLENLVILTLATDIKFKYKINNANYYVFWFLQQEFIHYFHHLELFCIAKFLLQIYKITLKTSGQYGNMNRLRIKRCMQ
jgi:hypothetical protein